LFTVRGYRACAFLGLIPLIQDVRGNPMDISERISPVVRVVDVDAREPQIDLPSEVVDARKLSNELPRQVVDIRLIQSAQQETVKLTFVLRRDLASILG